MTNPNSTPHMVHVPTTITIERADSHHIVARSGLKRLGYTSAQRKQLREMKLENSQWSK